MSKYDREIIGIDGTVTTVDVYRVLDAFSVSDPATQHAVKKMLCMGLRGHKDYITDLNDSIESLQKAKELYGQKMIHQSDKSNLRGK
ncbi:terminase large subunit [Escherichia phage vB_EcoS_CEB_EC3a]|uniref:Terminase large subunit n=1 Tax=Escherichia phage vB_EcoS_CEB_EC3a TaxID=1933774 RepID=A0A1Q1PWC7_9CAUD|nr:terminase large subunit [Escherichia phage vB_EcoS_CEB_EC3a]AQN32393.1 terminase large subunit [Escherichia phage vB_EcoS_CEB_EC3a]